MAFRRSGVRIPSGPPPQHLVSIKPVPGFAVRRGLRRRVLRGLRCDHGSLINIGFAFSPLNLLPMLIFTVVIATLASVIPVLSAARLRVAETLRYE
jgi:ABC-type lipoprotein release transport system permease subunit